IDNTACNLASLNLLKFYNPRKREFDVEGYEHGVRLWTVVLEISVLMAQFPSREIAERSYKYRTLGLGYANLGAMLMQAGVPYDSERGRALCGCLSATLTGKSYATSAELAAELGAFPGYDANKEAGHHMLRVIRNHRRAANGVGRDPSAGAGAPEGAPELGNYENLGIHPVPIDADKLTQTDPKRGGEPYGTLTNTDALLASARGCWDEALLLGEKHGYRNAQATVIAPTGTIGLLMDCDTTGVEPDFALVKFKKLAGGGYFKIANQSLRPALESLGYAEQDVRGILTYVMGTLSLDVPTPGSDVSFSEWLTEKGFNRDDLQKVTDALPTVFELGFAFNAWTLGPECMERIGLAEASTDPAFNLLKSLGLSAKQIKEHNAVICGTQTVEGAPALKDEHLAVFDCANTCGPTGERYIHAHGHIRMMAAAQPFISGAISKTVNLPNEATVEEMLDSYEMSWELGLKANALYRDGCKLSQPLNNKATDEEEDDGVEDVDGIEAAKEEVAEEVAVAAAAGEVRTVEKIVEKVVERPMRRRLPDTRTSRTHKFNVAGHEGYLTVGLYDDGQPGELFITMAKEGSTIGGLMDSLGTAISVALQYGVPTSSLVTKFSHQRFEPAGMTHNRDIPFAKSLVDYIFRWMGMEFVPGYREANAPQRPSEKRQEPAATPVDMPAAVVAEPAAGVRQGGEPVKAQAVASAAEPVATTKTVDEVQAWGFAQAKRPAAAEPQAAVAEPMAPASAHSTLDEAMSAMQSDAPACDVCGAITVRNGTCYRCLHCGASMGCS
ncbi:MAG: vitamin B12-dependent ribonucleotide reductase, partial [Planctomycetota bacterium]